jgi:hypothetical protein
MAKTPQQMKRADLCRKHKASPRPSTFHERMTIMTTDSSETPHVTETETTIISTALKRRAQSVINDTSIDPQWRAIIRYGLETSDPWLGDLVRRADAGEPIIDTADFSLEPQSNDAVISEERIEALTEMICWAGDESARHCSCSWECSKTPRTQTTGEHGEALCLHSLR